MRPRLESLVNVAASDIFSTQVELRLAVDSQPDRPCLAFQLGFRCLPCRRWEAWGCLVADFLPKRHPTGLRASEVIGLKWGNVGVNSITVVYCQCKLAYHPTQFALSPLLSVAWLRIAPSIAPAAAIRSSLMECCESRIGVGRRRGARNLPVSAHGRCGGGGIRCPATLI